MTRISAKADLELEACRHGDTLLHPCHPWSNFSSSRVPEPVRYFSLTPGAVPVLKFRCRTYRYE